jgi:hypothetical protein
LLYTNCVTALETFLADVFIITVLGNERFIRGFVETNPEYANRGLRFCDIFTQMENLEKDIRQYLLDLVWHNLGRVTEMYETTLGIAFPDGLDPLYRAIALRHDMVHRNGKTKDGDEIELSPTDIEHLLFEIRRLGQCVVEQLAAYDPYLDVDF